MERVLVQSLKQQSVKVISFTIIFVEIYLVKDQNIFNEFKNP